MAINRPNKRSVCRGTNVIFLTARGWNRNRSPRHFLGGFATCRIFPRKAQNVALKPRFPAFFVRLFHTARKLIWFSPNTHERNALLSFPTPCFKRRGTDHSSPGRKRDTLLHSQSRKYKSNKKIQTYSEHAPTARRPGKAGHSSLAQGSASMLSTLAYYGD